jgi:hypothetical protein
VPRLLARLVKDWEENVNKFETIARCSSTGRDDHPDFEFLYMYGVRSTDNLRRIHLKQKRVDHLWSVPNETYSGPSGEQIIGN